MVPDLCTVNVDIRLTPALDASAAAALLHTAAADTDEAWPGTPPTGMDITTRWPPYALPDGSPLRDALLQGAARAGLAPVAKIAGPSNIGNYLAGLGTPPPQDSAWTTRACTAPTNASAWTPYHPSKPPTTTRSSPSCTAADPPQQESHSHA
jgi:hypothetical protein